MKSRIRKVNGRIIWKLWNDHTFIEAVIHREEDIVSFLEMLKNYKISDGPDWYKNERGLFKYCLTMDIDRHTFCIYNAFDDLKHDYYASINFTEADRPVMIKSLQRYLARSAPKAAKE